MANAISLSDFTSQIIDNNEELKSALEKFSQRISEKYNAKILFCELYGKRWSYLAGSEEDFATKQRYKINDFYGIIYEKRKFRDNEIREIIDLSENIIEKLS